VQYETYALVMDTHLVIQNAIRLGRCMLEMAIKKNQASMSHVLLKMCKLIENRMADGRTPLAQFSKEIF
jgi:activating signal cointegrator complex subunit 3